MSQEGRLGEALAWMLDRGHRLHPEDLPGMVEEAVALIGAADVQLYFADLGQDVLRRFSGKGEAELDIDATVAGRAFRTTAAVVVDAGDHGNERRAWLPLLDGADRLGVLGALVESDDVVRSLERVAALLGELIVARSHYGDALSNGRRSRQLSLASELRWAMIPPLTFATERLTIAAFIAPPYDVAGDTFDYSVTGAVAHVAVFDAMGHGLEASRMANLAVGAYRHARRSGLDLAATYGHIDDALQSEFGDTRFVTAALAELDIDRGRVDIVLAGHPAPILLRDGKLIGELTVTPTLPLGLGGPAPSIGSFDLEPADWLLLYTDGVVDARDDGGHPFGVDRLADFLVRAASSEEPTAETMRRLSRAIAAHRASPLQDDASLLSVRWMRSDV